MNFISKLLIILLALIALPAAAQEERDRVIPGRELHQQPTNHPHPMGRVLDYRQSARNRDEKRAKRLPPEITPDGWFADYDYLSDLGEYLDVRHQHALSTGKDTYVYLYADWYEPCKSFRKSIRGDEYAQLFLNNEIIMLDYAFFNWEFGTQIESLPLFIKVNSDGKLGPEAINPVAAEIDHPRRAYYNLKKFFQSNLDTPRH